MNVNDHKMIFHFGFSFLSIRPVSAPERTGGDSLIFRPPNVSNADIMV